jgi:hypothetical protein
VTTSADEVSNRDRTLTSTAVETLMLVAARRRPGRSSLRLEAPQADSAPPEHPRETSGFAERLAIGAAPLSVKRYAHVYLFSTQRSDRN